MASTRRSRGFTALRIEGGILPPEFLQTIAALEAPRQTGIEYGLSKSLAIKEELARYWSIANDSYERYAERRPRTDLDASLVCIDEWLIPFLRTILGYGDLTSANQVMLEDRIFKLTHNACDGAVPLLLVNQEFDLDKAVQEFGIDGRRQAPHVTMQEYLNAQDAALWGIVSNGSKLRILRDNTSLTKPSYIEADLDLLFNEELYPDFSALWLTAHASRLKPVDDKPSNCIIESWRAKAHENGERIRENLRDGVANALLHFGNGFLQHHANADLRKELNCGSLSPEGYFQQLLRLVYRLLFLFTVEERNLLHAPRATEGQRSIFLEGYSLSRLRDRALRRRHYDRNSDLWQGLQITFRSLADGAPGLGLPPLGGLFRSDLCPNLDNAAIANESLLQAVRSLSYFRSGSSLARINYRDMDTEELGSVYESLLEIQPVIDVDASPWTFAFFGDSDGERTKGSERKLTGSYFTPPTLVSELIKSTLEPVISESVASRPNDPRGAILELKVVDPACGSGHFLLAAARRLAFEIVRIESSVGESDETLRQRAMRDVVRNCIYGVDRNPLAVELCKTALWIETVEPGKPLSFLDSNIIQGDSLIGILDPKIIERGIPADAYKQLTGDDRFVCKRLRQLNGEPWNFSLSDQAALIEIAGARGNLDSMPEETIEDIERKRAAWKGLQADKTRAREELLADCFVGAFLSQKTSETRDVVPLTEDLDRLRSDMPKRQGVEAFVRGVKGINHFLHWHIAFAEIMKCGGFDVVIGNPPWEVSQLNEVEFFSIMSPRIAKLAGASRKQAIASLEKDDPILWKKFKGALHNYVAKSGFCRGSNRYSLSNYGKLNNYALFAETFTQLVSPRGRAGLIVPTGIATDHSTKAFFENIVTRQKLVSLFDFENREKVFPSIDSRIKFCLLTLSGEQNPIPEAEFAFFLHQTEQLKEKERRFSLSNEDFSMFNPNTRTCPIFRTRRDMEIARKMYRRAGVLWREAKPEQAESNPWGISFMQMFNMTSDSGLFRTHAELLADGWELAGNIFVRGDERYLPLYEAKLFHQYDHRFATFEGVSERDIKNGNARSMLAKEKANPKTISIPRYWIGEKHVADRLDKHKKLTNQAESSRIKQADGGLLRRNPPHRESNGIQTDALRSPSKLGTWTQGSHYPNWNWQVALRLITTATNQRTLITSMIPLVALGHKGAIIQVQTGLCLSGKQHVQPTNELSSHLPSVK